MDKYKCFVFDFDDTIVLSEKMKETVFYEIAKSYGDIGINFYNNKKNKISRFQYLKELSVLLIENSLIDSNLSNYLYTLILNNCNDIISKKLKLTDELPNIRNFLEFLKGRNYKIFISSKSNEKDIIETLEYKKLIDLFDGIYGDSLDKFRHFEIIMNMYNFKNNEICFFGDSLSDYDVAHKTGCDFIGIQTDSNDLKNVECFKITDYNQVMINF